MRSIASSAIRKRALQSWAREASSKSNVTTFLMVKGSIAFSATKRPRTRLRSRTEPTRTSSADAAGAASSTQTRSTTYFVLRVPGTDQRPSLFVTPFVYGIHGTLDQGVDATLKTRELQNELGQVFWQQVFTRRLTATLIVSRKSPTSNAIPAPTRTSSISSGCPGDERYQRMLLVSQSLPKLKVHHSLVLREKRLRPNGPG